MSIEVLDETAGRSGPDRGLEAAQVERLAAYVMEQMRVHPDAELAVRLVEPDVIAALNAQWMDKDGPTDVLAFPMDELRAAPEGEEPEEGVLGDLVVCPAVAAEQATAVRDGGDAAHTCSREMELLVTHGILHLLGHDHAEPEEHRVMFALQDDLLARWRAVGSDAVTRAGA